MRSSSRSEQSSPLSWKPAWSEPIATRMIGECSAVGRGREPSGFELDDLGELFAADRPLSKDPRRDDRQVEHRRGNATGHGATVDDGGQRILVDGEGNQHVV